MRSQAKLLARVPVTLGRRIAPAVRHVHSLGPTKADAPASLTAPSWSPPPAPRLTECSPFEWGAVYGELSKSRLSGLVVATTTAGYLMTTGPLDVTCFASALGGTFLCAASANSFNQLLEVRNDAAMSRTAKRPLPSGRISPAHAAGWAAIAGTAGVGTLFLGTNCVTTGLGVATLGLYTLAYTPMKQRTPLNTWVGSVVGAIPPVMGWTAGGGRCAQGPSPHRAVPLPRLNAIAVCTRVRAQPHEPRSGDARHSAVPLADASFLLACLDVYAHPSLSSPPRQHNPMGGDAPMAHCPSAPAQARPPAR